MSVPRREMYGLKNSKEMNVPKICQDCFKFHNKTIIHGCEICNKLQFPEGNLCDLLRLNEIEIECGAYKPQLQLINKELKSPEQNQDESNLSNLQRKKWTQSYLVQQQKQDPDQIQFKLRYHLVLITRSRSAILSDKYFSSFSKLFSNSAKSFTDTTMELMWISSDHIHLYLDSSPDYSVDEIFQVVSSSSEHAILMKYPEFKPENQKLWGKSYFVETFG